MKQTSGSVARRLIPVILTGCLAACGNEGAGAAGGAGASVGGATGNAGAAATSGAGPGGGGAAAAGSSAGGSAGVTQGGDTGQSGAAMGGVTDGGGAVTGPLFPALLDACDVPAAHQQADAALAALLLGFWSGTDQYLYAVSPTTGSLTGYWTYAQAFDALLDGVERTGGARYRGLVPAFYAGRDQRGWLVDYFDDETWMTLALMRAFDLTGEQIYLDRAKTIYEDIMAAWDTSCCGSYLGGIWWNRQHTQKATASNAGPVIAGVRLTKRTGDAKYLDFAKQAYAFWFGNMVNPQSYAIYDHLTPAGQRAPGSLTYNHGIMIGAALELHAATGQAHFLQEAHGFGHYLATVATRPSSVGPLLHDGSTCEGDCAAWKGIGYRYLADLFRKDTTHTDYRDALVAGPKGIWTLARNADTNFFSSDWAGPPPSAGGIEKQGSAAMALNIHAMLCGSDAKTVTTAGRYEAEEATVNHVALEAKYAGFSGFGYVAAFAKANQGITFDVEVPSAGTYQLSWTYAAAVGAATRGVLVNGKSVVAAQAFAATAAWDAWGVATSSIDLAQGKSQIELRYAAGNSAELNLDRLDLKAQ
jgi:predicted alpha-1,6-mannanase (GH76 family)